MTAATARPWPPRSSSPGAAAVPVRPRLRPPTSGPVRLHRRPDPFSLDVERLEMPAGLTLAEMVELAELDPIVRERCVLLFDGEPVPRARWHRIRPKPGATLSLNVVPRDGRTALTAVLTLAVIVLAVYTGGAAAGLAGGAGTFGGALAGAATTAAIPTAGLLAVNALPAPEGSPG